MTGYLLAGQRKAVDKRGREHFAAIKSLHLLISTRCKRTFVSVRPPTLPSTTPVYAVCSIPRGDGTLVDETHAQLPD
jgi:hypothetical protein